MISIAMPGKKIGVALFGILFASSALSYEVAVTQDDRLGTVYDIAMKQNEKAMIQEEALALAVDTLVDSRCPQNATCFWQGDVVAEVSVSQNEQLVGNLKLSYIEDIPAAAVPFLSDVYQISLRSVMRTLLDDGQYLVNLRLVKKAGRCQEIMHRLCTLEYAPVTCTMGGFTIKASNPCRGRLQLEYNACLHNQFFDEGLGHCEANNEGFVPDPV